MTTKSHFWIVSILLCCLPVVVWAQTDPNSWEKLNLNSTTIAGATVYYEKSFEPNLPFFEKMYKEFLVERGNESAFGPKKNQILADTNSILGLNEPNALFQDKMWTEFLGAFSSLKMTTIYLVKQSTTKDFLRAGGSLPNFIYDKASDMVTYSPEITGSNKDRPVKDIEFAFPISSSEAFEKEVKIIFQILQKGFDSGFPGIAIHEIVEMSLFIRARPTDPYWRWFSDGFAEAVTYELLKKHFGVASAKEYIKDRDINEYKELEKEINLYYWMRKNFCIETPLKYENQLESARYSFATYEARQLIEKYGLDCVKKILDNVSEKDQRKNEDLLNSIRDVIGEDMDSNLKKYQTFQTRKDGLEKYASLLNTAQKKGDIEQMVINTIRLLELQDNPLTQISLQMRQKIALWLFKMGSESTADEVMLSFMEQLEDNAPKQLYDYFSAGFMVYALESNHPEKAQETADRFLEDHPDHPPALTIRMFMLLNEGKIEEAKEIARRICELSDEDSIYHKRATVVIEINPNTSEIGK